MNRSILLILFLLPCLSVNSQYTNEIVRVNNNYEIINSQAKSIIDFTVREYDNKLYFQFRTLDDTIPGYYIIYKSNNFSSAKLIQSIPVETSIKQGIILSYFFEDDPEFSYNFYSIIKIRKSQNININEYDIKQIALVNIDLQRNVIHETKSLLNESLDITQNNN